MESGTFERQQVIILLLIEVCIHTERPFLKNRFLEGSEFTYKY